MRLGAVKPAPPGTCRVCGGALLPRHTAGLCSLECVWRAPEHRTTYGKAYESTKQLAAQWKERNPEAYAAAVQRRVDRARAQRRALKTRRDIAMVNTLDSY